MSRIPINRAIEMVAERTYENAKHIKQQKNQRRYQVVDLYGVEMTRQGDSGHPAKFYISITPDLVYLERFEFKLIVQPFASSASGVESATVDVNNRSLSISGSSISPNPHNHTTDPHTHNVTKGLSLASTTADTFRLYMEGIDITPYLMAQHGEWVDGEGVFPSLTLGDDYDILEVASDLKAEGRDSQADTLVHPGYKEIQITGNAPFQVTMVVYLKLSHTNR